MKTKLFHISLIKIAPILAQSSELQSGMSQALNIVMLIAFIFGVVCVISGGFSIRRGGTDAGKMSIICGLLIAGAPGLLQDPFAAFRKQSVQRELGGLCL